MPLYHYRCRNCSHEFEARQRMSDDPLTECPVCQGTVRRVVNSVGIVFKGSGFYVTDNRNGRSASAPSGAKEEKSTGDATAAAAADSSASGKGEKKKKKEAVS